MGKINEANIRKAYELARDRYKLLGVDTDAAMARFEAIPVSLHCWQGDDVNGFEKGFGGTSGGILSTGNYPGRARTMEELFGDLEKTLTLLPGKMRVNVHALYGDFSKGAVGRDKIAIAQFQKWIDWARRNGLGLDFNPSFFGHPMAASGFTLSSPDAKVRKFWIDHGKACRRIAAEMGRQLKTPCVMNTWIPDGFKDIPVDRCGARKRLIKSLDAMFEEQFSPKYLLDAVESKLFGIGAESCTVGSNEFYMGYALTRGKMVCLDAGHFHPTEVISDKISSCLLFGSEILLHVSRPVRWDSDHVVIFDDELQNIASEILRNNFDRKVHIGLDFFDGTINRLAAWTIGTRSMLKALCKAALEPTAELRKMEEKFNNTGRLALLEELKTMPFAAVWDFYCLTHNVPVGMDYMEEILAYEKSVLSGR
ncbi:MAG: L-rhamnose isomerase [Victivallaceae bacterium]|nr:L-rhamnose isomerase [Victivallaceae bacterium]